VYDKCYANYDSIAACSTEPESWKAAIARLLRERSAWLGSLSPEVPFLQMFHHIPGVCFFAKDRDGRAMFASRGILERYQMSDERQSVSAHASPSPPMLKQLVLAFCASRLYRAWMIIHRAPHARMPFTTLHGSTPVRRKSRP
jgi:hypothetical protein